MIDVPEPARRLAVRTPDGVAFSFRLASPFLRMLAWIVDIATVMTIWIVLEIAIRFLALVSTELMTVVAVSTYFVLSIGYDIASERLWRGQTIGKRLLRLRVVDASGLRLAFAQSALRAILRPIDMLPAVYLLGGLVAYFGEAGQRLGDLAGGTLVIWEPVEPTPDLQSLGSEKYNSLRDHPGVIARLRHAVEPAQARAAYLALQRRGGLEVEGRLRLFSAFAAYFKELTPIPDEAIEGLSDEQLVRNIVEILYVARS